MKNVKVNVDLSLGFILGIVFVVLKLCGVISWPWVWVLAPFWVSILLGGLFLLIVWMKWG